MNKVFTSAVVIIPPKDTWEPIQEVRKQYDRQIKRWMPHINLIYPFRPEKFFKELSLKFEKKCSDVSSFHLTLSEIRYFSHGKRNYTIWLAPEPEDLIKILQEKILKIVPDCDDVIKYQNGYVPHLSLGQITGSMDQLKKVLDQLQKEWIPLSFWVDIISLISRKPNKNSRFQVLNEIKLNSAL